MELRQKEMEIAICPPQDDIHIALERIEAEQKVIREIIEKKWKIKKPGKEEGDENEKRGNWSNPAEFLLSCLGYAVGLGNVWRFPYLCYKNGGGAFFIPYVLMLFLVGMPMFLLELTLGQFSSQGPMTCWQFAPIFKGIGFSMIIVSGLVFLYYNVIMAWSLYYLFASFTSNLPWKHCGSWADQFCSEFLSNVTADSCTKANGLIAHFSNGTCVNATTNRLYGIFNITLAKKNKISEQSSPQEYLDYVGLQVKHSPGFEDFGKLRWDMSLCFLLAWIIVFLCMIKGIKSSGKVVYFTALFPYAVLIILFINGLLQEGYMKGITFYVTPDMSRLKDAQVWKDAAAQIFFSLATSWGGLIALSSYSKFKTDVVRDMLIVTLSNCLTSLFAGFVIFSYLGHLAHKTNVDVSEVAAGGVGLAFTVYPFAVMTLPGAPFWSILFFAMLLTLGLDSQFTLVETIITALMDQFPKMHTFKTWLILGVCLFGFFLGLPMCTQGGPYLLTLIDDYSAGWNVIVIAICECIAVAYVYGAQRFCMDIETMTTKWVCKCIPWRILKWWWITCWCFLSPGLVLFIMIFSWVKYAPSNYDGKVFPDWANALGWLMTFSVVLAIFIPMIVLCIITKGTCKERCRKLLRPTKYWGPALVKFREEITYVPGFCVDPEGEDEKIAQSNSNLYNDQKYMIYDNITFTQSE